MGLGDYFAPGRASKRNSKENRKSQQQESKKSVELRESPPTSPWQAQFSGVPSMYGTPGDSRYSSRPGSIYPAGDFRNSTMEEINDIKCEVMVNWLHSQQEEKLWTSGEEEEGVVLKKSRGMYTCSPADLADEQAGFFQAVQTLNVKVAMTVNTRVIRILLHANQMPFVEIQEGLRIQVLPDVSYLPRCQKHQFAAFIADRGVLVVWDDDPKKILGRVERLETALMKMIWGNEGAYPEEDEKKEEVVITEEEIYADPENPGESKPRRVMLMQAFISAASIGLTIGVIGAGWRNIVIELMIDKNWIRLAFILAFVPQFWLALFFFQCLATDIAQLIGPVGQVHQNTKFYSGKPPKRLNREYRTLPHVTIQCPVYKESLYSVIEPTIRSLKTAISTYEMQGGTANIFVNDDGMQLIDSADARARQDFYDEHNIGWVSRPKHNPKPADGEKAFVRGGKFKKASNMNYALWVSQRVEDKLATINRPESWTQEEEAAAYKSALADVVSEDEGMTWADGNIRMGDYILVVDSDTRVPVDCLLDAVSELEQAPQVAILQYKCGVMNVTTSFFEKGITFFTNLVYTQIAYAVANGDVSPFVGHNAFLRWTAIQSIAYDCPLDNREKFWSESTVSEDFDLALRLQSEGYLVRMASYTGDGFKEGVSLTVYDELARWEKYAYGCSELIFHPFHKWFTKGPITPLFRRFLFSCIPLPSKFTICAYVGTYYAIGSTWILTMLNYFATGWFNGHLDHYYMDSFKIFFSIVCIFSALGPIALSALRYRIEEKSLFPALFEYFCWIPLLTVFLGGISLHVSQAILSHLFGINMQWGATAKEAENITFFQEIPRVIKRFKYTFSLCLVWTAMLVVMSHFAPFFWRIDLFIAIFPMGMITFNHFMMPIVLNPNLMLFTW